MICVFMLSLIATVLQQAFTGTCPCHKWQPNIANITYNCLLKTWNVSILPFNPRISTMYVEFDDQQLTIEEIPDGTSKTIDSIRKNLFLWTVCRAYHSNCVSEKFQIPNETQYNSAVQDAKCDKTGTSDVTGHTGNTHRDESLLQIALIVTGAVFTPVVLLISGILVIYKCSKKSSPSLNRSQGSSVDSSPNSKEPNTSQQQLDRRGFGSCLTINGWDIGDSEINTGEVSHPLLPGSGSHEKINHPTFTEITEIQPVMAPPADCPSPSRSLCDSATTHVTVRTPGTPHKLESPTPSNSPVHNLRAENKDLIIKMTLLELHESGNVVSAGIVSTLPLNTPPVPRVELPKHL